MPKKKKTGEGREPDDPTPGRRSEQQAAANEELRSANEELATVNDELQNRNMELSESNNDLTNLIASVPMAIVMVGPDLRIRRYTPIAEKLLNLIPGDIGRSIADIKLNLSGLGDIEIVLVEAIDSVSTKELEVQDKYGHWYLLRIRPYRTSENKIEGAVIMLVDTDALKRNEGVLRESEARFKVLADSAPVLMWVNDLEGCQFVNRAYEEFVGASEAELKGFSWTKYVHTTDRGEYMTAYMDAFNRRVPFEHKFRLRRFDGEFRWMKATAKPRFLPSGEFMGYVGCTFDISEMKEAEAAWLEMERRKNEFLATLAHELRNPLSSVKNASYLLTHKRNDSQALLRASEVIERQTGNMVRLVDDLLDVSRLTHGKIQLQLAPVDLNAVIQQAITATEHERSIGRQELAVELAKGPVWVRGDAARLDQVFSNLLDNASKYSPAGGHVWLKTERSAASGVPEVVVSVRDDGIGMEPELMDRIFDLFVHGERQISGGMGLGLTLAKRLIEWHGGTIEVKSAGRSKGSEFIVHLPTLALDDIPVESHGVDAKANEDQGKHRVLVVEDNADAGETLADLLRANGHPVELARDGADALRIAYQSRPDVILLDIGMPDMDGYQIAQRLREQASTRNTTIVAVSGYGRREDAERSREAGIDKHMTKPVRIEELLEVIRNAPYVTG